MDKEKKSEKKPFSVPEITDEAELAEIKKIAPRLDNDEKVHLVVKRIDKLSVSGTIFVTNKRIIMTIYNVVDDFSYEQLSDVSLTITPYFHTLVIKIHRIRPDEIMLSLKKKMTEIHEHVEWKEDTGFIKGIPPNKGKQFFELVQTGIKEYS